MTNTLKNQRNTASDFFVRTLADCFPALRMIYFFTEEQQQLTNTTAAQKGAYHHYIISPGGTSAPLPDLQSI